MANSIQNIKLLKALLNPVPKNRKHYKYLEREDEVDENNNNWHKYTLNGILSLDYAISDIYLLFFKSFYNITAEQMLLKAKSEEERCKIKQQNISKFYREFVRLIYMKSLIGQQGIKTDHSASLVLDFIKQNQKDKDLTTITKRLILQYSSYYKSYWQKDNSDFRSYKPVKELRAKIKEELNNFYKYIQQNWVEITLSEKLPYPLSQNYRLQSVTQLLMHVQKAYQHINNICIFSRNKKKEMLENMQTNLSRYMNVKVNETGKGNILFSRLSQDKQAVITKLLHHMVVSRVALKSHQSINKVKLSLVKEILILSKKFYKLVGKFYPLITADDIIINQKSLKPILDHKSLIYDVLGIQNKDTTSIQLQMAMNSTPRPIQFQKSYFQMAQDAEWALIRKYFIERNQKKKYQWDAKNREWQIESDISDQDIKQEKYENCPMKSWDVEQKTHVWRLICIFYKIIKQKHLIQWFYNTKYQKLSKDGIPPFKITLYEKALQQLHNQFCKKPEKILNYLGLSAQANDFENFDFRLRQLQKVLKMQQENEDSLMQKYCFETSKSELWVRGVLLREIFQIILKEKYFKRMLNAKKYMIMFSMLGMQLSYESIFVIWQDEKKPGARNLLINQLNEQTQYKKYSFAKQRERERTNFQNINKRLNQYLSRKDEQNKYLQANKEIQEYIKTIYENINTIQKNQKQIAQIQLSIGADKSNLKLIKNLISQIKSRAKRAFNLSSNVLTQVIKKELQNKLQKVDEFHKIEAKSNSKEHFKQILKYINKRFYYIIKTYQTVTPFNFRKYQTFILPFLLQSNSMGVQLISGKTFQDMNEVQLGQMNTKIQHIKQILEQYKIMEITQNGAIEPKMAQ